MSKEQENQFNTLETARAEIVRLQGEVTRLTNERDTFSTNLENANKELKQVRDLNQDYFNKLVMQQSEPAREKDEVTEDPPTCEDFAKTLKI